MKQTFFPMAVLVLIIVLARGQLWAGGAASPAEAYRRYVEALYRADPDQATAVITGASERIAFIRTFIDCVGASNIFRNKYIAAYGQTEWDKFAQPEAGSDLPAFHLPGKIPLATYRALLKKQPLPDGRGYKVPQANGALRIIPQGGLWYLDAASLGFEGRPSQYAILAAVLREYQTRIGDPGETPAGLRSAVKRTLRRTGEW
jgi:hypothetical protein